MTGALAALQASVAHLRDIVQPLTPVQLRASAYPSEWSIADVLSHLGSGGVIMQARIDAGFRGEELAEDFPPRVWDEWNAKTPDAKVADALAVDRALADRLASMTDDERGAGQHPARPDAFRLRRRRRVATERARAAHLGRRGRVASGRDAPEPRPCRSSSTTSVMIIRFSGKPVGADYDVHVRTADPVRDYTLALGTDGVTLTPCADASHATDLELPAEALVRLVYGRLDPAHTPPVQGDADLDALRRAFPGV